MFMSINQSFKIHPGKRMLCIVRAVSLVVAMMVWVTPTVAQRRDPMDALQKPTYQFTKNDFVRAFVDKQEVERRRYCVGQPVIFPIIISNHTRYPITIQTSFNPRSMLRVNIRPELSYKRKFAGPYVKGYYPPLNHFIHPLDELHYSFVIWGDLGQETGLAFPEPGRYTVEIQLEFMVVENGFKGRIDLEPVTIEVINPPSEIVPLIEELKADKGFVALNLKQLPEGWLVRVDPEGWLVRVDEIHKDKKYPPSYLTPYLCYSAANEMFSILSADPSRSDLVESAQKCYQVASLSDSAFQIEILLSLLEFYQHLDLSIGAAQTAKRVIQTMPRYMRGSIGNSDTLQKYLINTKELDLIHNWSLLE